MIKDIAFLEPDSPLWWPMLVFGILMYIHGHFRKEDK